jgi:membrane-bound serine protease (ClpP class)
MNLIVLLNSNPDAALVTLFAGIMLVYYECNRPGSIVPGCLGALLTLLSINAFVHTPLEPSALALTVVGIALILIEVFIPTRNWLVAAGTTALIAGFATLVQPFAPARVHIPTAIVTGSGLSAATLWLARIALRARRNKRSLSSPLSIRAASQRRTG